MASLITPKYTFRDALEWGLAKAKSKGSNAVQILDLNAAKLSS
jgi:hypothetical protein